MPNISNTYVDNEHRTCDRLISCEHIYHVTRINEIFTYFLKRTRQRKYVRSVIWQIVCTICSDESFRSREMS